MEGVVFWIWFHSSVGRFMEWLKQLWRGWWQGVPLALHQAVDMPITGRRGRMQHWEMRGLKDRGLLNRGRLVALLTVSRREGQPAMHEQLDRLFRDYHPIHRGGRWK